MIIYLLYLYPDFKENKLSATQHDELNKDFDDIYDDELLKQKISIDKNNLNCM